MHRQYLGFFSKVFSPPNKFGQVHLAKYIWPSRFGQINLAKWIWPDTFGQMNMGLNLITMQNDPGADV